MNGSFAHVGNLSEACSHPCSSKREYRANAWGHIILSQYALSQQYLGNTIPKTSDFGTSPLVSR
jgi:hypothetical protein